LEKNVFDKFQEECGLIGVWNHEEAANLAYLGLYAQQHRGQEGAGVVALQHSGAEVASDADFSVHKGLGLVADVFDGFDFGELPGRNAVGHVRYTTAGGNRIENVQPFFSEIACGHVALAHNGNLTNTEELRRELVASGAIFRSTSDTEVILHLLARAQPNTTGLEVVTSALQRVEGAYSLCILFQDRLFALRDPFGIRPLCIGTLGDGYVVASETCAFDLIGATYLRDVEAGEIVEFDREGNLHSHFPFGKKAARPCIFEYVYFARPDSSVFGRAVYSVRKSFGKELAREHKVVADLVIPVPDSGVPAAMGYAEESGIPFEFGLIRNHYVGRTFIEPQQAIRDFGVKIKLNPNREILAGKRIVVVDDSIVRGTTSRKLVAMLRAAGAAEVHLRISAPPTTDPCYYGIDTPEKEALIASSKSVDEIRDYLGVDSLAYLSDAAMYRAVNAKKGDFCDACFSGDYPIKIGAHK
jgi:amidophosphoribosyltransferase